MSMPQSPTQPHLISPPSLPEEQTWMTPAYQQWWQWCARWTLSGCIICMTILTSQRCTVISVDTRIAIVRFPGQCSRSTCTWVTPGFCENSLCYTAHTYIHISEDSPDLTTFKGSLTLHTGLLVAHKSWEIRKKKKKKTYPFWMQTYLIWKVQGGEGNESLNQKNWPQGVFKFLGPPWQLFYFIQKKKTGV